MLSWEDRKTYSLKKEDRQSTLDSKSPETTINEILETIASKENNINTEVPTQGSTREEDLLNQFEQYSDFSQDMSD